MSEAKDHHIGGDYIWDGEYKLLNDPWFWFSLFLVIYIVVFFG